MLRNLLKNRKAQNTAEYALLIALVVAGIIAMQTYAQRGLQARIHDAAGFMSTTCATILDTETQYEPYYSNSQYSSGSNSSDNKYLAQGTVAAESSSQSSRNGNQTTSYNATGVDTTTSTGE